MRHENARAAGRLTGAANRSGMSQSTYTRGGCVHTHTGCGRPNRYASAGPGRPHPLPPPSGTLANTV